MRGDSSAPRIVAGDDPAAVHQRFAAVLDDSMERIAGIQQAARDGGDGRRPAWPMVVLRTPRGLDLSAHHGRAAGRGYIPGSSGAAARSPIRRGAPAVLEQWLRSYRPEELFDDDGRPVAAIRDAAPTGDRRMSANPATNGGIPLRDNT